MSIVGTSWTVVVTDKRSRKLSQSMDEFNVSINGHSHTVLNFILYTIRYSEFQRLWRTARLQYETIWLCLISCSYYVINKKKNITDNITSTFRFECYKCCNLTFFVWLWDLQNAHPCSKIQLKLVIPFLCCMIES